MTDALFAYAIDICITQVDMEWEGGIFVADQENVVL